MKIAIISDTHRDIHKLASVVQSIDAELFIHLGDHDKDMKSVGHLVGNNVLYIKGNTDYNTKTPEEMVYTIEGKKILITHGHNYHVKYSLTKLYYRAKELEVDIVFFGHTHVPVYLKEDNIIFFNPGSLSFPRAGNPPSYGLGEITFDEINLEHIFL